VTVLVGQQQKEFSLNRKLLCETSTFFRKHLETPTPASSSSPSNSSDSEDDSIMWLPAESPDMFELFVLWLYQRRTFLALVDQAIPTVHTARETALLASHPKLQALRWNLARLHVFAAVIDLPALQDLAMDALQDLYLRCDMDVSPRFVAFLYQECDAEHAVRLRKWAVAMLAWSLHGADRDPSPWDRLFVAYPALADDYRIHLSKMVQSKADVRIKNPQLRLPMNKLRSGERFFGFRLCSFHSHRASVGEAMCPHLVDLSLPLKALSPRAKMAAATANEEVSDSEQTILSPVGEQDLNVMEISFLDLS